MTFTNRAVSDMTLLPNVFIDEYMPRANGEYVKLYLYLLRLGTQELSVTLLADRLELTERDVMRALRYWRSVGLIEFEAAEDAVPESLELLPLSIGRGQTVPAGQDASKTKGKETGESRGKAPEEKPAEEKTSNTSLTSASPAEKRRSYETAELLEMKEKDEQFADLLVEMQMYFGRTLSPRDIELLAYLYEELKMPADLLEYLLEYCVERDKKTSRYMETVALNWHKEGKLTLEAVKKGQSAYSQVNKAIMKAFGIQNRTLSEKEQQFAAIWSEKWSMPLELISEACERSLRSTGKASFEYANRILEDWYGKGYQTLEAVKKLDAPAVKPAARNTNSRNSFDFEQRTTDYDALLWQQLREEIAEEKENGTDQ